VARDDRDRVRKRLETIAFLSPNPLVVRNATLTSVLAKAAPSHKVQRAHGIRTEPQRARRRCASKSFMAISISAIENEGILFATVVAVTVPPISPSMNLIASRTKSIFTGAKRDDLAPS
jgi:hypothetical protein